MKKLIFTWTILFAVPFVPAQTYDWKIASQPARDDESAVRINWQGHSYLTDHFSITPFAEMRLTRASSLAQARQVMLEAKLIANDASNGASFGNGVAISGDTAVIGAWWSHIGTKRWQGRSAASSLGQRSFAHSVGPSQTRRITLIRNASKNGYTTTRQGDLIYFQAANVEDPSSGKLLAGLKQLEYQCSPNLASITVNLQFSNGHSDRINVSCLALIKPRIILQEERSEPN